MLTRYSQGNILMNVLTQDILTGYPISHEEYHIGSSHQ